MLLADMEKFEAELQKELVSRRGLGGYSADAATIYQLCLITYELVRHQRELLSLSQGAKKEPSKKK